MYQRILLAYDGSESGQKALLDCRDIAQWSQSELYLIAVMPSPAVYIAVDGGFYDSGRDEEDKQRFKAILEDGLRRLKEAGRAATGEMLVGDAVQEITDYAQKINADLIVVGHKHLKGWAARWWRGSTSASLIENAHCNVLVVITH
ncbi:MAG: universal stress protein [Burkholderiaceae bacterium]|jgi:nucleotide-binding universal stress UspA family protein|nr:universal stress protein [Burkholderiaceae bacterium]MDH5207882.1 universal stress protein [Burkholderiaceae bacterium]